MNNILEKQEIIDQLTDLAQLDIDAYHAYEQAIVEIEGAAVREQLLVFKEEHRTHYLNLSETITKLGAAAPEFSKGFKGHILEGLTAIRSMSGTKGALKAMQSNEQTTTKRYREALGSELPPDIRSLLERHHSDEKKHLAYMEKALKKVSV
jgi:rubrerythrin